MKNKENLKNLGIFIEATINKDSDEAINESISTFIKNKISNTVLEYTGDSRLRSGKDEDVYLDGHLVGKLRTHLDDPEKDVTFYSIDGKYSKPFPEEKAPNGETSASWSYQWLQSDEFMNAFKENFKTLKMKQGRPDERLQRRIDSYITSREA